MQVRLLTVEDECIAIGGGVDSAGNEGQYSFIEHICVAFPYRLGPKSASHFRITR